MTDKLKIRPFDRSFNFGSQTQTRCSGMITDRGLRIRLGASQFDLEGEPYADEHGQFVLVEPTKQDYGFGFIFSVEQSFEEDEEPGVCISLQEIDPMMLTLQQQLPKMNVLYPPRSAMSLYLNSQGRIDGSSGSSSTEPSKNTEKH